MPKPCPFSPDQLAFLQQNFAAIPHDHSWEQVKDVDGETLAQRVIGNDETFDSIEERLAELEGDPLDNPDDGEGDQGEGE